MLFELEGRLVEEPTRYTVQVGIDRHVESPDGATLLEHLDRYLWRFLDHSCDPNARIVGRHVVAVRRIEPGDAVTFDYCTNEYDMATPFDCGCGAVHCRGRIAGYRALDPMQRAELAETVSDHVLALAAVDR